MDWGGKVTTLGMTALNEKQVRFGIKDTDRTRHLAILGRTGSGRGDLVASMALQDIGRGLGALVLDANGNVAPLLLDRLATGAIERLIYLDPADAEYPYSWNPLDDIRALPETLQLKSLTDMLGSLYDLPAGPLVEEAARLMVGKTGTTLASLFLIVTDQGWRKEFFGSDTEAQKVFEDLIAAHPDTVKVLEEKGKYVVKDTLVRNLVGQRTSKFTLENLGAGSIVVVDLSKIRMFPTRMAPLVRVFVDAARAACRHASYPVPLYLHDCLRYLDDRSIEHTLADSQVAVTIADTIVQEANKDRREKALSRCGSIISFTTHPSDRSLVERAFYPYASSEELMEMEKGEMIAALTIDAVRTKAFFAKAIPLPERVNVATQDIMVTSRQKYTTSRISVDESFRLVEKDGDGKGPKDGSFSDAFRNIFAKRAGGTAAVMPPQETKKPEPVPAPPAAEAPPGTTSEKSAAAPTSTKVPEIPEQDLRSLLYVTPVGA